MVLAGHAVGEYLGDGRADVEHEDDEDPDDNRTEPIDSGVEVVGLDDGLDDVQDEEGDNVTDTAHPLLFFFDTESTGLNIYNDHIVEIAAKVTGVPLSAVSQSSYSSLVHTSKNIPSKGNYADKII